MSPMISTMSRPGLGGLFAATVACLTLLLVAATGASPSPNGPNGPATGGPFHWFVAGSTGTVDEADLDIYKTSGSRISVRGGGGVLNVRYNVGSVENLTDAHINYFIQMRYKDNGADARVVAKLKEQNVQSGVVTTRLVVDSDDYSQSGSFQSNFVFEVSPGWTYDFNANVYWIEVTITRSSNSGKPSLAIVNVGTF